MSTPEKAPNAPPRPTGQPRPAAGAKPAPAAPAAPAAAKPATAAPPVGIPAAAPAGDKATNLSLLGPPPPLAAPQSPGATAAAALAPTERPPEAPGHPAPEPPPLQFAATVTAEAPAALRLTPLQEAAAKIEQSAPRGSEPEVHESIARLVHGRDPEASLDIPPPTDVTPPEEREPGATDPYIGTTFDHRYKIQKLLGEGGMGFVYLARHKVIDKKVAVKVLRADLAKDKEILDRFLQEAKAASSIGNPHIVDISDFGEVPDGSTYFVMEFLEGHALGHIVDAGERISVERICHIATQIADGLSAAHAQGIVHRDLKPDNVFLISRGGDHDFVKVLDFGIAKVTGNANTKLTKAGAVFGTPHYMSPEQAAGAPIDHRTDIYALGVMLYEMVSGQLPFNADNFMGILTQHMYKAPVPIRALVPGPECPPSLEAVILKCLSKKPESRYQSMDELAADLERVRTGQVANAVAEMMARSGGFNVPADYFKQPNAIVPATPPSPQPRKLSRYVWIAGAAAAVGLTGAIFVISGITGGTPPPQPSALTTAAAAPSATPTATATVAATATAAPVAKKAVAISAQPDTAEVVVGNEPPHKVPWTVEVEEGKPVTVEVRAEGYIAETIRLDGTEGGKIVKLKWAKPVKGSPVGKGKPPVGPTKKPGGKGGEVIDPWGGKG